MHLLGLRWDCILMDRGYHSHEDQSPAFFLLFSFFMAFVALFLTF